MKKKQNCLGKLLLIMNIREKFEEKKLKKLNCKANQ